VPDAAEDFGHGFAGVRKGYDELVLQEAALAVHAVPVVDGVEGVEEGVVWDCFVYFFADLRVVVEFVKGFDGQGVQCERGEVDWQGERQALFDGFGSEGFGLVVVATHEDAPAQVLASDQEIDPGHGVFELLV
jgi:hypothetical protein